MTIPPRGTYRDGLMRLTTNLFLVASAVILAGCASSNGGPSGGRTSNITGPYVPAGGDQLGYAIGYQQLTGAQAQRARSTSGLRRPRALRGLRTMRRPRSMRSPVPSYGNARGLNGATPTYAKYNWETGEGKASIGGMIIPLNSQGVQRTGNQLYLTPGQTPLFSPVPHQTPGAPGQTPTSHGGAVFDPKTGTFIWR